MPTKEFIIDPNTLDFDHPIATIEDIRKHNPQRFEMEQLTAILHVDLENHICVGYRDVTDQEFWCRGHLPGVPLMPGVIMCEAAPNFVVISHNNMICWVPKSSALADSKPVSADRLCR